MTDTATIVLSGLGGVGVTVVAGFVGAWVQSRRETSRWLRERRFESYSRYLALMEKRVRRLRAGLGRQMSESDAENVVILAEEVSLIGPPDFVEAVLIYSDAIRTYDGPIETLERALAPERQQVYKVARRALGTLKLRARMQGTPRPERTSESLKGRVVGLDQ